MAAASDVTAATILHHTTSFLERVLAQPDLRRQLLSSAGDADASSSASAEKLPSAHPTALSSLLLSLDHARRRRHLSAASSLLDLFVLDPALARSELAPSLFEALFIPHLLPAIQRLSDRRSRIISSGPTRMHGESVDADAAEEDTRSVAFEAMNVLSRMSGGQAEELRELEKWYEDVMDENCRIYAGHLKQILQGSDGSSPPQLVFTKASSVIESDRAFSESDQNFSSEYESDTEENNDANTLLSLESTSTWSSAAMGNPPKDFVCPITSNVFDDPVTLETGQTYERRAIQEWLGRGNSTCPITRQPLSSTQLPKTNYVLKRLIAGWLEENPRSTSPSPTSVISQAAAGGGAGVDLRLAVSRLCTSDVLDESETAVLQIDRLWRESESSDAGPGAVAAALSKPAVVNGFVEILFNSVDPRVLATAVLLLAELASRDAFVGHTLTRVESDVDCLAALFRKGLAEAAVLICSLGLPSERLVAMDMVDALVMAVKERDEGSLKPRAASILVLWQMMRGGGPRIASEISGALVSGRAVESIVASLGAESAKERMAAVGILARCMEEDGGCRSTVADRAELAAVMESFSAAAVADTERFEIVRFLYELAKLSRRTSNQRLLRIVKEGGVRSTMHALLAYLQTAPRDQSPAIAALLLQLDLLAEPKMASVYREEAVDALVSCLKDAGFPDTQLLAAQTISSLQGRFSHSGKPLVRALLLKRAGMSKSYRALLRAEQRRAHVLDDPDESLEEERAADEWERRMAFALAGHEFGLMFEALADGMESNDGELFSACHVSATWLVHMLSLLPDTGVRGAARVCLLRRYVSILKSSGTADDKALAMLALRSFIDDPEGMNDLAVHIKDIMRAMRELKKSSALAYEMLKLLSDGKESSSHDFWNHKELNQVDCSANGEVLSIVYFRNTIVSGHSDGTMKVWGGGESILDHVQDIREHTKAVTSMAVAQAGDRLFSGSVDKTVRVWSVRDGKMACVEVHDMKDQVNNLAVASTIACFSPQGAGVKVVSWNGGSKMMNPNKYVRCLALVHGKLYCGCQDSSIQEIDLATGTTGTIQTGNKKLLGKANPIYALQVNDGLLYSAGTASDGPTVKIHNASNYGPVGSLPSAADVRSMAISADLIYMGCKAGLVDVWSKEKLTRVGTLQTGRSSKVQCMALDGDGEVLVVGTSDGRIQAWGLT